MVNLDGPSDFELENVTMFELLSMVFLHNVFSRQSLTTTNWKGWKLRNQLTN